MRAIRLAAITLMLTAFQIGPGCAIPTIANPIERAAVYSQIYGKYDCRGSHTKGNHYTGTVTIGPGDNNDIAVNWVLAGGREKYSGTGTFDGNLLVVDWGQKHPVIYRRGPDGVLHGTWDDGRGLETLTPR